MIFRHRKLDPAGMNVDFEPHKFRGACKLTSVFLHFLIERYIARAFLVACKVTEEEGAPFLTTLRCLDNRLGLASHFLRTI